MAHFIYGVAENTGKGFFTAEDRRAFFLRGYPANVWMVGTTSLALCGWLKKGLVKKLSQKHKL